MTTLPDGEERLCYFVDFEQLGEEGRRRVFEFYKRHGNATYLALVANRILPILAERVTMVESESTLWAPKA